jgi:hypothetical protein
MSGTKMSSISISVKTSLVDDMGILCVINPNNTIGEVLAKVTDDLGLDETAISLVRLMPGGKAMHSRVLNPTLLTETGSSLKDTMFGLFLACFNHSHLFSCCDSISRLLPGNLRPRPSASG